MELRSLETVNVSQDSQNFDFLQNIAYVKFKRFLPETEINQIDNPPKEAMVKTYCWS